VPTACENTDTACKTAAPISGNKLVDNEPYAQFKGMTTGRCGMDPDVEEVLLNQKELDHSRDVRMIMNDDEPITAVQNAIYNVYPKMEVGNYYPTFSDL